MTSILGLSLITGRGRGCAPSVYCALGVGGKSSCEVVLLDDGVADFKSGELGIRDIGTASLNWMTAKPLARHSVIRCAERHSI